MTEKLWDRKPSIRAIDMHYQHTGGDYEDFYEAEKMDRWLAEVKQVLIDDREKIHFMVCRNYEKRIRKLEKRLSEFKENSEE